MSAGKRILYVDDDQANRVLVRKLLKASGLECLEAEDGLSGIALAAAEKPDLILMDISMPGMDGYEATRRIKAQQALRRIPVIAVTAHAMQGDRERALTAGCDGYITKPINIRGFVDELSQYLARDAAGHEG